MHPDYGTYAFKGYIKNGKVIWEKFEDVGHNQYHCVFGSDKGIKLVNHKGITFILYDGKQINEHPSLDNSVWNHGDEIMGKKDGALYVVRVVIYNSMGTMMLLVTSDKEIYAGASGYGIGDHWWKNSEGYEYLYMGDMFDERTKMWCWDSDLYDKHKEKYGLRDDEPLGINFDKSRWPTYKEWERDVLGWAESVLRTEGIV